MGMRMVWAAVAFLATAAVAQSDPLAPLPRRPPPRPRAAIPQAYRRLAAPATA